MLKVLKNFLLLGVIGLMSACDRHYSVDEIQEVPEMDKEFYNTALAYLNNSIEDYPSNADNYYKKALVLMEFKNYGSAMLQAKKAATLSNNDPEYLYLLSRLYAINDKTDLAIETALKAMASGAPKARFNSLLAEMYLEKDSLSLAFHYINDAIAANPQKKTYYFLKGKIYLALKDTAHAEKSLLLSIEDTDLNAHANKSAYLVLSNIYFEKGQYIKAGNYIEQMLEITPRDLELLYQKGLILSKMNLVDSAKKTFIHIVQIDSAYEQAFAQLSHVYFNKRNWDSAAWYAKKAVALRPGYIDPMLTQARVLDRKRQYNAAVQKYQEILAIDSTQTVAWGELKYLKGKITYLQRRREEQRQRKIKLIQTLEPIF